MMVKGFGVDYGGGPWCKRARGWGRSRIGLEMIDNRSG